MSAVGAAMLVAPRKLATAKMMAVIFIAALVVDCLKESSQRGGAATSTC